MPVRIEPVDNQNVVFELPYNGNFIEVTVPALDCLPPKAIETIGKAAEEKGIPQDHTEFIRLVLEHTGKSSSKSFKNCIAALTARQLVQIDKAWNDASELPVGESSPSGESS